jgi:hypothetical protein
MADSKGARAVVIQDAIRQILYHEWDPIGIAGVGPGDEYDAYIAPVYRVWPGAVRSRSLSSFFFGQRDDTIGVACETAEHFEQLRPVARRLLEIDVRL